MLQRKDFYNTLTMTKIEPFIAVGPIRFGQNRNDVISFLLEKPDFFNRGYPLNHNADLFINSKIIVEYLPNETVGLIEIIEPIEIKFLNKKIIVTNYENLLGIFKTFDPSLEEDTDGFISKKYGLGVYKEGINIDSFYVMSKIYFDIWYKTIA